MADAKQLIALAQKWADAAYARGQGGVATEEADEAAEVAAQDAFELELRRTLDASGVPEFDATQLCLLTTNDPTRTYCLRCKNPHHKCDRAVGVVEAGRQIEAPSDTDEKLSGPLVGSVE